MGRPTANTRSRFVDRVSRLLERVDYRRAETGAEREAIYKIRYEAYFRENFIEASQRERLYDASYDESPNGAIFGVFIDGELASTIRIHVAAKETDVLPSMTVFGDVILPYLRQGRIVVDPTRFATRLDFSRLFPELSYITVRLGWVASEYFGADLLLATARAEHRAYYKRLANAEALCEPRDYPLLNRQVVCMGFDYSLHKRRVEARYPFFVSMPEERERLFGGLVLAPAQAPGRIGFDGKLRARA